MMKRIVFIICFFMGLVLNSFAQEGAPKDGPLEALKIAYLTNKLKLSTAEAQKFWPLYNRYVDELRQVNTKNRDLGVVDAEERVVNIKKKYRVEFTHALPEERVNQFFKEDREFGNYVRKELQEREQMRQARQQNKRPF